jgi:hypothetical protein
MSAELGRNIYAATMNAAREISGYRPKPECALKYLEPYFKINSIDGLEKSGSDTIMSLYSATVADCYREKGDVGSAAQWYRRASVFSTSCGFADLYADMVIQHRLSDHYEHALMCVEQGHKKWKSNSLQKRIYYWLVSLYRHLKHPWDIPKLVSLSLRSRGLEQKLKQLVAKIN